MIEYQTESLVEFHRDRANDLIERFPRRYRTAEATDPRVQNWVKRVIASPEDAPSLLLAGPTGTGKTHQAFGAIRAIAFGLAERGERLTTVWTTHAALNDRLRPAPDGSHRYALDDYVEAGLLLLDDVAAGITTEWTADSLYRLVDTRWSEMRVGIYTTNLGGDELTKAVGDRLLSRIVGMSTTVVLGGGDRRQA